jgi:hypothetical protein
MTDRCKLVGALMLVLLVLASSRPLRAHVGETGQDYGVFRRPDGTSCCNNKDCRPVQWRTTPDGRLYMFPEGRQVYVPPNLIINRPSDDGNAHWCGIVMSTGDTATFCAILPPQSM